MSSRENIRTGRNLLNQLDRFIGPAQRAAILNALQGEEALWFLGVLQTLARRIATMPASYETDGQGSAAVAHLRYFAGGSAVWHITEKDREAEQLQAFGLADLFGDGGELGYISIDEILVAGGELDLHFTPKTLREIRNEPSVAA